jgi:hypothetical protein
MNEAKRPATGTELIWEGKYDKDGRRSTPLRVALPFQTVETVNESVQERQLTLLRESSAAYRVWDAGTGGASISCFVLPLAPV